MNYRHLALYVSRTLKQLNQRVKHCFRQRVRLNKLAKENPDNIQRYNTKMSYLHQNSADCDSVVRNGLEA